MNYYHICTKREYIERGMTKAKWYRVGLLKETTSGRRYITLYHQPETSFYVFEPDEKASADSE